jgi:F-box and leucine-rich repeat protein GRR1
MTMVAFRMFDLPHALLGDILTTWLHEVDFICFDNAICDKYKRKEYLDIIRSDEILLTFPYHTRHDSSKYLIWLKLRNVYLNSFTLPRYIGKEEFNSKVFKKIKHLNFSNCGELDDRVFYQIVKTSKYLQELIIGSNYYSNNITDHSINVISETALQLRKIEISQSKLITDSAIITLTKKCHYISEIKLINCTKLSDVSINGIADNCQHLEVLKITNNNLITSSSIYQVYNKCKSLQVLTVIDCSIKSDSSSSSVAIAIASVIIPNNTCTSSGFLLNTVMKKKNSLQKLNFSRYRVVSDVYLQKFLHNSNLLYLSLEENQSITDTTIITIASSIPTIISLNLSFCLQLTDIAIVELMKYCHALQHIDLQACKITDEAISHIVHNSSQLQHVNFNWCVQLTDNALHHLIDGPCTHLTELSLNGCNLITSGGIHELLTTNINNKIKHINVSYCARINTYHVEQLRIDSPTVDITHIDFSKKTSVM